MTTYCANCDNEAHVLLRIREKGKPETARYPLPLCCQCKDAFDWGQTHANDDIEEDEITQDDSEEEEAYT